ncbi:unnamed protein product, partial [marine sediment metagenome]
EIGTNRGGMFYLLCSISSPNGIKISLDLPHSIFGNNDFVVEARNAQINKTFKEAKFINGDSRKKESKDQVKNILQGEKLDLLFIDGDHRYDSVSSDWEMYKDLVKDNGFIVFHDINDSERARAKKCEVGIFWKDLKGTKIEFNEKKYWAGIGIIINNEKMMKKDKNSS